MNLRNETEVGELERVYCGVDLHYVQEWYSKVHGYASLVVCQLGSVANVFNMSVLSRKEMRTPTNAILTALALADLLVMLDYIPYSLHLYLSPTSKFSYKWAVFVLFHSLFSQVCHTVSICLTVMLAAWRYIAIAHPQRSRLICGMKNTLLTLAASYLLCPLLCIPLFLALSVHHTTNTTSYFVDFNNEHFRIVNFWIYGVAIKLLPCLVLTFLFVRLISALFDAKQRRRNLIHSSDTQHTDRTTRMLLAVLFLFLLTELPQGILGLFSALLGEPFFTQCYLPLGDIMDITALINSAINFILYCSMSRQFRTTFFSVFWPRIFNRRFSVVQTLPETNNGHSTQVTQV